MKKNQILIAAAVAAGIFLLFRSKAAGASAPLNFGVGWGKMPGGFVATSPVGNVDIGFGALPSGQAKFNGLGMDTWLSKQGDGVAYQ